MILEEHGHLKSRLSKWLGDFGEGLVVYALASHGWFVTRVDDLGADLQAVSGDRRLGISVKFRMFRKDSKESRMVVVATEHLANLDHYCELYALEPVYAQGVSDADDDAIHLFVIPVAIIRSNPFFRKVKYGYSLRFSERNIQTLRLVPEVYYQRFDQRVLQGGTIATHPAERSTI